MKVDKGGEEELEEGNTERLDVSPELMTMLGVCRGISGNEPREEEQADGEQKGSDSESESEEDEEGDSSEEEQELETPFTSEDMRVLLAETVKAVSKQIQEEDIGELPYSPIEVKRDTNMGSEEELAEKRLDMRSRVEELRNQRPHRIILNRSRAYNLRKRKDTEYRKGEGVKVQPNWMKLVGGDESLARPPREET
jgi:hypothetical protein